MVQVFLVIVDTQGTVDTQASQVIVVFQGTQASQVIVVFQGTQASQAIVVLVFQVILVNRAIQELLDGLVNQVILGFQVTLE